LHGRWLSPIQGPLAAVLHFAVGVLPGDPSIVETDEPGNLVLLRRKSSTLEGVFLGQTRK